MKHLKKMMAFALALLLVLTLSACTEEGQPLDLTVSLPQQVTTLDPAMVTTETEKTVVYHLFENLMKLTDDTHGGSQVVYGAASSYQCENNLDGTQTWTFSLRGNATWADGKPVRATDFVYAWRRLADPATASPNAYVLDMVAGYEEARKSGDMTKLQVFAEDDRTLVVVLSHNYPNFIHTVCVHPAAMPVREDMVQAEDWSMTASTLVGNGPYRVVDSWQDDLLTVKSSEDYYDYRRLGPASVSFSFGGSSEADFVLTHEGVSEEGWQQGSLPYTGTLVINQMSTVSEEVRQAMSLVIDRYEIAEELGSMYVPAEGLIPNGIRGAQGEMLRTLAGRKIDSDPERYEARCQSALDMIRGQGLPDAGELSLTYVSDGAADRVAKALQKMWYDKLGLTVTLRALDEETMAQNLDKGEFSMALVMLHCERDDASFLLEDWVSGAEGNYANIHNSAFDLLMRSCEVSSSAVARDAYLIDAEQMLLESGYVVPVCFATDSWKLREDLKGVFADGVGAYFFTTVARVEK